MLLFVVVCSLLRAGSCMHANVCSFQEYICFCLLVGWDMEVPQLSKGQKARLTITHDLAYGERGYPPVIPPRSTLVFDVELISFA